MLLRVFVSSWQLGLLIVMDVIGWDIGGVNTKVARVTDGVVRAACGRPYELQRDPRALVPLLRALAAEVGGDAASAHAVTMTAELSQLFRTKREGVAFVLAAVEAAFRSAPRSRLRRRRPLPHDRRGASGPAGRGLRQLVGDGPGDRRAPSRRAARRHRHDHDRHHPDRRRYRRRRRVHRSRAPRLRRAGVHRCAPNAGRGDCQPRCDRGHPGRCVSRGVRTRRRCAPVARRSGSGRLHVPHARRPPRDTRVCRRADRASGVRRSRAAGRSRGVCDRRCAGPRAGGAHCRGDRARARASSVAANGGRHRPGRISGRGGGGRGRDARRAARGGARRGRRAVRASRFRRPAARARLDARGSGRPREGPHSRSAASRHAACSRVRTPEHAHRRRRSSRRW